MTGRIPAPPVPPAQFGSMAVPPIGIRIPAEVAVVLGCTKLMSSAATERCTEREPTYPTMAVQVGAISRWMLRFQFRTSARFGFCCTYRFLTPFGANPTLLSMPLPSVTPRQGSAAQLPFAAVDDAPGLSWPMIWNGDVAAVFRPNSYGSGSTSKIPKPPRTAVFPFFKGSHEKPIRGSKFLEVGLLAIKLLTGTGPHAVGLAEQFARVVIS